MKLDDYEEYVVEEMGAVEMQDWKYRRGNTTPNRGQFSRGNGHEYRPRPGCNRGQENMYGRGMNYRSWSKPPQPSSVATEARPAEMKVICKQHHNERCIECFELPAAVTHTCNALLAEFVELKCGCTIPVVADACKVARKGNMPVTTGKVNGKSVSVLRDTGCSTIVVKRDLVEDSQLTGKETSCVLIDGTIRRTPLAKIHIDTEYYKGDVEAVCMKNPLYQLIVGNMKGIKEFNRASEESVASVESGEAIAEDKIGASEHGQNIEAHVINEALAVVTRQMKRNKGKVMKPLKVTAEIDGEITRDEVLALQKTDETLKSSWEKVDDTKTDDDLTTGEVRFTTKAELLYRMLKTREGRIKSQLVLPKEMRENSIESST